MSMTVVGIGEILWDIMGPGKGGGEPRKQMGGAPANFAFHAGSLGMQGITVSAVGDDMQGGEIIEQLRRLGLSTEYVSIDHDHPTGTVSVELDEHGKPTYTIHEGVAWDYVPSTPALTVLAGSCDAVCFGSLAQRSESSRSTILSYLANTRDDALRVFDINLRRRFYTKAVVEQSLTLANILKINDEELPVVCELLGIQGDEGDALRELACMFGLRAIALTRGPAGSLLLAGHEVSTHPGFTARVVDTVGAGDSYTAAFVCGLLRGHSLDRINEHANRVAAFVCSREGACPELPETLCAESTG